MPAFDLAFTDSAVLVNIEINAGKFNEAVQNIRRFFRQICTGLCLRDGCRVLPAQPPGFFQCCLSQFRAFFAQLFQQCRSSDLGGNGRRVVLAALDVLFKFQHGSPSFIEHQ